MPRVESFSLLAPAWGSSFFVMSRVDSFSLLAPAWGSSPAWRSWLLISRVDSFLLLAPAWGGSSLDHLDVVLESSSILPNASPAWLLDVWCFFSSRQQLSLL